MADTFTAVQEWLFNPTFWLPFAALAVALGVVAFGAIRGRTGLIRGGGAAVIIALLWLGVSHLFESDREIVTDRSEGLVDAYRDGDWQRLRSLLDAETILMREIRGPDDIATLAEMTAREAQHGRILILETKVEPDPTGFLVDLNVFSEQQAGPVPTIRTAWRLSYRKLDGRWTLTTIEPLPTDRIDPDRMREEVQRR